MKKAIYTVVVIAVVAYGLIEQLEITVPGTSPLPQGHGPTVQYAYDLQQSNLQVRGKGIVSRILPDDTEGSRHQRFILAVDRGPSLLIAHNIDLAPRINGLQKGDTVEFYGEYEWNSKGGVLHWTHHDPGGRHDDGWLKHKGKTYQ